jgi:hypothetical protein
MKRKTQSTLPSLEEFIEKSLKSFRELKKFGIMNPSYDEQSYIEAMKRQHKIMSTMDPEKLDMFIHTQHQQLVPMLRDTLDLINKASELKKNREGVAEDGQRVTEIIKKAKKRGDYKGPRLPGTEKA